MKRKDKAVAKKEECPKRHPEKYLCGKRILPPSIKVRTSIQELVEQTMLAFNAGRLRAACLLLKEKYSKPDVTVGMSLAGALTPAGLGPSCIIPLMKHGFVDWIVATGAIMYHDIHFAFDLSLYQGSPKMDDAELRKNGIIRIYDVVGDYYNVLLKTDQELRKIFTRREFQKEMGTQEFYYLLGKVLEEYPGQASSILVAAYRLGIPVFTSSPGDSTIGMNIAGLELLNPEKFRLRINPSIDINESTAIVLDAKISGKSGVILIGGGSPKNFMLQTEPQIQEVLQIQEKGHDYDINITDARPDTGGLSGATPSEAVSWGKIDPTKLEESVVCYGDITAYFPIIVSYVLNTTAKKIPKKLYLQRKELFEKLRIAYFENNPETNELEKLLAKNKMR